MSEEKTEILLADVVRKLRKGDTKLSCQENKFLDDFFTTIKRNKELNTMFAGYGKTDRNRWVGDAVSKLYSKMCGDLYNGKKTGAAYDNILAKYDSGEISKDELDAQIRSYSYNVLKDLIKKQKIKEDAESEKNVSMDLNGIPITKKAARVDDDVRDREVGNEKLSDDLVDFDEDDPYHDNKGEQEEPEDNGYDAESKEEKETEEKTESIDSDKNNENDADGQAEKQTRKKVNAESGKLFSESAEEEMLKDELTQIFLDIIEKLIDRIEEQDSTAKVFKQFYQRDERYKKPKRSADDAAWLRETLENSRLNKEGKHAVVFVLFFPWNGWRMADNVIYGYEAAAAYINCKIANIEFDPKNSGGYNTLRDRYLRIAGFLGEIFKEKKKDLDAHDTDMLLIFLDLLAKRFEERKPNVVLCKKFSEI